MTEPSSLEDSLQMAHGNLHQVALSSHWLRLCHKGLSRQLWHSLGKWVFPDERCVISERGYIHGAISLAMKITAWDDTQFRINISCIYSTN